MVRKYEGFLVTFESTCEGIGKTTQALKLVENLNEANVESLYTKEPYTPQFRAILKGKEMNLSPSAELFLMNADRAQHFHEVIEPALIAGKVVVCDRYFDSTLAYQGYGLGWDRGTLEALHCISTGFTLPDITFVFDGEPFRQRDEDDRFEARDDAYFERVRKGMLELSKPHPQGWVSRYRLIQANRQIEEIAKHVLNQTLMHINMMKTLR